MEYDGCGIGGVGDAAALSRAWRRSEAAWVAALRERVSMSA